MRKLPEDHKDKLPKDDALDLLRKDEQGNPTIVRQERKYELITPLFGGGVEPMKADPVTVIRGTEIRGQLRFWWRAIRGGQFGNSLEGLEAMKKKEAELWGAASATEPLATDTPKPLTVQLAVFVTSVGSLERPFKGEKATDGWNDLAYAAFPLMQEGHPVVRDIKFTLRISYPVAEKPEVEAALWAWETFGGLGARTRRGFGALRRLGESWPSKPEKIAERIKTNLGKHIGEREEWPDKVPYLSKNLSFVIVTKKENRNRVAFENASEAWEALIKELKGFRQKRDDKGFGRSRWPEPEQIRRLTGQRLLKLTEDTGLLSIHKFPRAAFGLPIIFHFKDGNGEDVPFSKDRDPVDTTLKGGLVGNSTQSEPKYRERLASPLILRPLACGNNTTQAIGLAFILEGPRIPPEGLVLSGDGVNEVVESNVNKSQAGKIELLKKAAKSLQNDDEVVDVLQAFLAVLRDKEEQ